MSICIYPYSLLVYDRKGLGGKAQVYPVNTSSAIDGAIRFDVDPVGGVTGSVWKLTAPTGCFDDRYNQEYMIEPSTGVLNMSGVTGAYGGYNVDFTLDMSGVTGVQHGDYYGLRVAINPGDGGTTGLNVEADVVIKADDTFKAP